MELHKAVTRLACATEQGEEKQWWIQEGKTSFRQFNIQMSPIVLEMSMHLRIVPRPRLQTAPEFVTHNSFDSGFSGLGECLWRQLPSTPH
jgi:hypothetical protein